MSEALKKFHYFVINYQKISLAVNRWFDLSNIMRHEKKESGSLTVDDIGMNVF